jgi:plastocyanin
MKRLTLALGLVALAAVLAACSGASAAPATQAPASGAPAGDAVSITAKDLKFVPTQVSVKADEAFSVDFDNQDSAPHNVKISAASGAEVFKGKIVSSSKVVYPVGPSRRHLHLHLQSS